MHGTTAWALGIVILIIAFLLGSSVSNFGSQVQKNRSGEVFKAQSWIEKIVGFGSNDQENLLPNALDIYEFISLQELEMEKE